MAGLSAAGDVHFDEYGIPHIYAQTWADAVRILGYLHASDRLWQMDMFRRQASGNTAEIIGKEGLESDLMVRRLGIRRSSEALWKSDQIPAELRQELQAYTEGVNLRMQELGEKLPLYFQALGYQPHPWTEADCLVFNKYMGWDQSGTNDDLWFGTMVDKLGVSAVEELWPLDRPYEEPTVEIQVRRQEIPAPRIGNVAGAAAAFPAAFRALSVKSPFRGLSYGSNNWAIDGTKTKSCKPMLCNDPHLGFQLPSIWYTAHLSANGKNVVGATFPGSPGVVIGHNDRIAWGITNMQSDAVDYFVETIDPDDPLRYRHRGAWRQMERITEKVPIRGEEDYTLEIDNTVHGPIISRDKQAISLCWTGLGPTAEVVAFWEVQHAENLTQFLQGAAKLVVPALNLVYADVDGNIAIHPTGTLPIRTEGQGRIPLEGASGEFDWKTMIPRDEMPLAVNPRDHFVASANGCPTGQGYPYYLGWMWDCSYRKRRINDLLKEADNVSLESMKEIQLDAYDKAAERFLPPMLAALPEDSKDQLTNEARRAVADWDYIADHDAIGATIWLRWLSHYRDAVWDDEWETRGIEKIGGSWGFSGTNRRDPMLEVLEFLTRDYSDSRWFDDRRTPEVETRDDIARRSFASAIASLRKDFGETLSDWRWDKHNVLFVRSLSGQRELGREGGAVVGDAYTLNPGGNIGGVGGGASFRMIVDFGQMNQSICVYPGGQNENPTHPNYADQIPLWAKGSYVPMRMESDAARLATPKPGSKLKFRPGKK